MPTPYAELTVDQGTTFETSIDLVGDDGAAINIAGYSFSAQIRKSYYSSNVTANLTISTVNVAGGNIILSMNSATTTNIRAGRDRKSTRLNSSHVSESRMPSSA